MRFVSYQRKSTKRKAQQAKHSLESQAATINSFIEQHDGELVGEFYESHSGMDHNRPELKKALDLCRAENATLIVASLCRLSRSISQVDRLFHSSVKIVVCEYGMEVSMETILLFGVLNQLEVEKLSRRIKIGMATAKSKGQTFGANIQSIRAAGVQAAAERARADRQHVWPILNGLRLSGMTWKQAAAQMNVLNLRTPRGKEWTLHSARHLYLRGSNDKH